MQSIYKSPLGLSVEKYDWDDQFTITGKLLKSETMKEFDGQLLALNDDYTLPDNINSLEDWLA